MKTEIKLLAQKYQNEIDQDFHFSKMLIEGVGHQNEELVEFVNHSAIISMCIKYESFTSEAMFALKQKDVAYNKPWQYTRFLMSIFKMDADEQYAKAHDAWEYYNSIKHENAKSRKEQLKVVQKYRIKNSWDALRFVHEAIDNLLEKFKE